MRNRIRSPRLGVGRSNPHHGAARKSGADEGPLVTRMTDAGPCHLRVARLFLAHGINGTLGDDGSM
jgi:hypothetical protein